MANREKLQWLMSKLEFSTEDELKTLLIEALTLEMAKQIVKALNTFAAQRGELAQWQMAEKIGQMYRNEGIKYPPPLQMTISRFESGDTYPNLKPTEEKIWAKAYNLTFDEFCQMVDELPFPVKKKKKTE